MNDERTNPMKALYKAEIAKTEKILAQVDALKAATPTPTDWIRIYALLRSRLEIFATAVSVFEGLDTEI